jgi:hypothetical protein
MHRVEIVPQLDEPASTSLGSAGHSVSTVSSGRGIDRGCFDPRSQGSAERIALEEAESAARAMTTVTDRKPSAATTTFSMDSVGATGSAIMNASNEYWLIGIIIVLVMVVIMLIVYVVKLKSAEDAKRVKSPTSPPGVINGGRSTPSDPVGAGVQVRPLDSPVAPSEGEHATGEHADPEQTDAAPRRAALRDIAQRRFVPRSQMVAAQRQPMSSTMPAPAPDHEPELDPMFAHPIDESDVASRPSGVSVPSDVGSDTSRPMLQPEADTMCAPPRASSSCEATSGHSASEHPMLEGHMSSQKPSADPA